MILGSNLDLPVGELDEHHLTRLKNINHVYFCPNCKKTFDSKEGRIKCELCSADLIELEHGKTKKSIRYRYYCPVCEKNFTFSEKAKQCVNCGNKRLHMYEWEGSAKTDSLRLKMVDVKSMFWKLLSVPLRAASRKNLATKKPVSKETLPKKQPSYRQVEEKEAFSNAVEDIIIEQSNFLRPLFRINPFSRRTEETPTG